MALKCAAIGHNPAAELIDGGEWQYFNPDPERPGVRVGITLCHSCLLRFLEENEESDGPGRRNYRLVSRRIGTGGGRWSIGGRRSWPALTGLCR